MFKTLFLHHRIRDRASISAKEWKVVPSVAANSVPARPTSTTQAHTSKTLVYKPQLLQANTTVRQFLHLKNGYFEQGYYSSMPGWHIDGRAFNRRHGNDMYTWQHFNVVPVADIGGDYWKDIQFHIGYKHQYAFLYDIHKGLPYLVCSMLRMEGLPALIRPYVPF